MDTDILEMEYGAASYTVDGVNLGDLQSSMRSTQPEPRQPPMAKRFRLFLLRPVLNACHSHIACGVHFAGLMQVQGRMHEP